MRRRYRLFLSTIYVLLLPRFFPPCVLSPIDLSSSRFHFSPVSPSFATIFLSASHFRFNLIPQVEETKPENEETKKRSRGWKFEYFRLCNFFARCPFSQINPSVGFKIKRLFYFIHVIFHLLTTTFIILTITIITIKTLK